MQGLDVIFVPDLWLPLDCWGSTKLRVSIVLALEPQLGDPDRHAPAEYILCQLLQMLYE